jgi:chromosome segregation ATPase
MARLSQIIRLEKVGEQIEQLKNDRRLSYLAPAEGGHEESEGMVTEEEFLKEAKTHPKRLFDIMYHRQMKLYETLNDNEKEYNKLLVDYNKLAEEDNELKDDYAVLQIEFSDLQKELEELKKARDDLIADRDLYMTAFART